jgi:hypothetical protein
MSDDSSINSNYSNCSNNSTNSTNSNKSNNSKNINSDDNTYIEKNFDPEVFFANNQRQFRYYKIINKFFRKCDKDMIEKMVKIINKDKSSDKDSENSNCISLRVLEWVVTKCSKKNIDIQIVDKEYFSINIMYKAQLKSYKKKNFDPFRRDRKFYYNYDKNDPSKTVVTTLGQLNFFKWAISNKIIECVEKHYPTIIETMNKSNKEDKLRKKKKKDKLIKSKSDDEKSKLSIKTKSIKNLETPSFIIDFD